MSHKMSHPESKQELQVDADNVAMYESQGWQTATTAAKNSDGK